MNYYLVWILVQWQTDGWTDRKWRIRAHSAIWQGIHWYRLSPIYSAKGKNHSIQLCRETASAYFPGCSKIFVGEFMVVRYPCRRLGILMPMGSKVPQLRRKGHEECISMDTAGWPWRVSERPVPSHNTFINPLFPRLTWSSWSLASTLATRLPMSCVSMMLAVTLFCLHWGQFKFLFTVIWTVVMFSLGGTPSSEALTRSCDKTSKMSLSTHHTRKPYSIVVWGSFVTGS